jgi:hypothetical protein
VVKQCVATDGVQPDYVRAEILPEFFKNFWVSPFAIRFQRDPPARHRRSYSIDTASH